VPIWEKRDCNSLTGVCAGDDDFSFRERHAGTIDSGKQKYGDFRERHADTIDSGKQKYGNVRRGLSRPGRY
jgi:hypothetical protein